MEFRIALPDDADSILEIYRQAQASLKARGVDQWQNGYPNPKIVEKDIASEHALVCTLDGLIGGVFVLSFDHEANYDRIYNGRWASAEECGVIHRMALADAVRGQCVGSAILFKAQQLCFARGIHSIRVDTHRDNKPMQSLLQKNQFTLCGVIYLEDQSERLAYEKLF